MERAYEASISVRFVVSADDPETTAEAYVSHLQPGWRQPRIATLRPVADGLDERSAEAARRASRRGRRAELPNTNSQTVASGATTAERRSGVIPQRWRSSRC